MRRLYYEQFTNYHWKLFGVLQNTKTLRFKNIKSISYRPTSIFRANLDNRSFRTYCSFLETYIAKLHQQYAPKTVKRKIASLKALFHHLEYKEIILHNPFAKLQLRFREPIILPKTIPLPTIEVLINTIYEQYYNASSNYRKRLPFEILLLSNYFSQQGSEYLSFVQYHTKT